jgi:hypothetical protein
MLNENNEKNTQNVPSSYKCGMGNNEKMHKMYRQATNVEWEIMKKIHKMYSQATNVEWEIMKNIHKMYPSSYKC